MYSNFSLNYPTKLKSNEFVNIPRICFRSDLHLGECDVSTIYVTIPHSSTVIKNTIRKGRRRREKALPYDGEKAIRGAICKAVHAHILPNKMSILQILIQIFDRSQNLQSKSIFPLSSSSSSSLAVFDTKDM